MTHAVVASLPVESRLVPGCLESLIDMKVRGAALNFLQQLIDYFCTWFYCPYHALYLAKMARVHPLQDASVKLYDATRQGVAGVDHDFITIYNRRVYFDANPRIERVFSRRAHTDYITVRDAPSAGCFQIIVQDIPRPGNPRPMETSWTVNATRLGAVHGQDNVYLVNAER